MGRRNRVVSIKESRILVLRMRKDCLGAELSSLERGDVACAGERRAVGRERLMGEG
jgi:hypothetical protein